MGEKGDQRATLSLSLSYIHTYTHTHTRTHTHTHLLAALTTEVALLNNPPNPPRVPPAPVTVGREIPAGGGRMEGLVLPRPTPRLRV